MLTKFDDTTVLDALTKLTWQNQLKRLAHTRVPTSARNIMVGIDFSPASVRALDYALNCAHPIGCSILIVHAMEPVYAEPFLGKPLRKRVREQTCDWAHEQLNKLAEARAQDGISIYCDLRFGAPAFELLKVAEALQPELIILGRSRRGLLSRWIFGSVSKAVLDVSRFPVLVVPSDHKKKVPLENKPLNQN